MHKSRLVKLGLVLCVFGLVSAQRVRADAEALDTIFENLPDVNEVTDEATKQAIWDQAAEAQSTAGPNYGSTAVETKDFEGFFVPAQNSTDLWVFSDDGVTVYITDYSEDPIPSVYLNRKGAKQHLSRWENESLWKVNFDFDANQVYLVRVAYSNENYYGPTDIDGCTLFATNGGGSIVKVEMDHDLWWFNGENPGLGYHVQATLTAHPMTTGTFKWDVTAGADKVDLNNNGADGDSITATDDNTVTIKSTAASASAAAVTKDVKVKLTHNGVEVYTHELAVFAPDHLHHVSNTDNASGNGYQTIITYQIRDQFDQVLPHIVPWNEDIDGNGVYSNAATVSAAAVSDWANEQWTWVDEGGVITNPANARDGVSAVNMTDPTCQNPQNPLGTSKIDHSPQGSWYVGSTTIGDGVDVSDTVWQTYRDHARHE